MKISAFDTIYKEFFCHPKKYFLESSVSGKVTVPRVEEKEINKTTFKDGRAGFGIQFNTVFYITSVLQRSMAHRYNLEVMVPDYRPIYAYHYNL